MPPQETCRIQALDLNIINTSETHLSTKISQPLGGFRQHGDQ